MESQFSRTEILIGEEGVERLKGKHVAVFGVGGVGGHAVEALVRSGIGRITIIDNDVVSQSNINRQVIALHSTIGREKVEVMKERLLDINPELIVEGKKCFFLPENSSDFDFKAYDYVVDAIDTITAKIELILCCREAGTPVISCMGAGNKLDPSCFKVADIYDTSICPLAKVMRRELKKREIKKLTVVYSTELPVNRGLVTEGVKKAVPGSIAFIPAVAGLMLAGKVIRELAGSVQ